MYINIPVYETGIRNDEYIIGTSKANKWSIIHIKGLYPPNINNKIN